MTAEQLRDLRVAILVTLYRVTPRSRSAESLHRMLRGEIDCQQIEVASQLSFLQGEGYVVSADADDISPGLAPVWSITSNGIKHCEAKHYVP